MKKIKDILGKLGKGFAHIDAVSYVLAYAFVILLTLVLPYILSDMKATLLIQYLNLFVLLYMFFGGNDKNKPA